MTHFATGFDFESLPNSDVLIQFVDDEGKTINTQVVTRECLARMPVVVHALGRIDIVLYSIGVPSPSNRGRMPEAYAGFAAEIGVVTTIMDTLRMVFDSPPRLSGEHGKLVEELRSAIRAVDVSGLIASRDRLLAWLVEERQRPNNMKGT